MPRATTQADPLADLREPEPSVQAKSEAPAPEPQRDPAALIVAAWHADSTASSFGHGGGTCGCAYLARRALAALEGTRG